MNLRFTEKDKIKNFRSSKLLAFVFVFLFSFSVFAKNIPEYQKSIKTAELTVAELVAYLYDLEEGISDADENYERQQIAKVRENIPSTEKIEWQNAVVETGNQWLGDKLDAFLKEKSGSPKREQILLEVSERLSALSAKLKELGNPANSNRSKDEEKQKIDDILRREEYQKPSEKEKSLFEKWREAIIKWLDEVFPSPKIPEMKDAENGVKPIAFVLQILLYAVVIGIIAFVIYKFAPFFVKKFRKRAKHEKKERVILGEKIAADESSTNIFDEAEKLAREGKLRDAIRKGYIAFLCELSDRKIIGLAQHKTNRDYLRDVRGKSEIYDNMNGLTNSFERHWYGFESADETDWSEFRRKYQSVVSRKK